MSLPTAVYKCPKCGQKYTRLHLSARHPEEKTLYCFACAKERNKEGAMATNTHAR